MELNLKLSMGEIQTVLISLMEYQLRLRADVKKDYYSNDVRSNMVEEIQTVEKLEAYLTDVLKNA